MMKRMILGAAMLVGLLAGALRAEESKAPATKPAEFLVGPMHMQKMAPQTYLYTSMETTLEKLAEVSPKTVVAVEKTAREGKVQVQGPCIFVYEGMTGEMDKPFQLQIGLVVAEGTKPVGDLKVRKLDEFPCATVLYTGAMSHIAEAYGKFMAEFFGDGHTPTGEAREYHLYWEGVDSPNNVTLILMGMKD